MMCEPAGTTGSWSGVEPTASLFSRTRAPAGSDSITTLPRKRGGVDGAGGAAAVTDVARALTSRGRAAIPVPGDAAGAAARVPGAPASPSLVRPTAAVRPRASGERPPRFGAGAAGTGLTAVGGSDPVVGAVAGPAIALGRATGGAVRAGAGPADVPPRGASNPSIVWGRDQTAAVIVTTARATPAPDRTSSRRGRVRGFGGVDTSARAVPPESAGTCASAPRTPATAVALADTATGSSGGNKNSGSVGPAGASSDWNSHARHPQPLQADGFNVVNLAPQEGQWVKRAV